MFRVLLIAWMMVGVLPGVFGPRICRADGKIFAAGPAKVAIPDQDAMIVWRDGVETLAIETRFVGPGHDFAWVVPLPAKPEVSPGTTGMFPTLRALTAPKVEHRAAGLWPAFAWVSVFILVGMSLKSSWGRIAVLMFAVAAGAVCFFPALGKARGGSSPGPAVDVLDRRIIGSFEVTIVTSSDPDALGSWLKNHGFASSRAAEPVIADYITRGWCFAAAKLKRDEDTGKPSTPHPLVFMFRTTEPVYPLALTSVENGDLKVDLYVFGPSRAAASGFEVKRCAAVGLAKPSVRSWGPVGTESTIELSHTGLAGLIGPGLTCTKLSATLTPKQQTEDATIRFAGGGPYQPVRYSDSAALDHSMDVASGAFLVAVVFIALATGKQVRAHGAFKLVLGSLVLAIGTGAFVWSSVAMVETKTSVQNARWRWNALQETANALWSEAEVHRQSGGRPDDAWVRAKVRGMLAAHKGQEYGRFEEGDGPGEYRFEILPDGQVKFRWYSEYGAECCFAE